jgi:hypothetical protein
LILTKRLIQFEAGFNTPENKVRGKFGKTDLFKNFGFSKCKMADEFFHRESAFRRQLIEAKNSYRCASKLYGSSMEIYI